MTSTEVDTMDAGSLRAAYKVLMNEHQVLLASYEVLVRQTVQLEQALQSLRGRAPTVECDDFHHGPKDLHEHDEECPPLRRYEDACLQAVAALAKHGEAGK